MRLGSHRLGHVGRPRATMPKPGPLARAERVPWQHDPLFANGPDLSHGLAVPADKGSGRTRTSTTLCTRDTSSWALAERVTDYRYRIYRLGQLFGQVTCFACSLRQMSRGSHHFAADAQDIVGRGRRLAKNLFAWRGGCRCGRILARINCRNGERRLHAR